MGASYACLIRLKTHLVKTASCPSEQCLSHSGQRRGPTAFHRMVVVTRGPQTMQVVLRAFSQLAEARGNTRTTAWMYRRFLACRSNLSVGRLMCPGPYSRCSKRSYVEAENSFLRIESSAVHEQATVL